MSNGMHCIKCGGSLAEGLSLFRVNEKGVPGIWNCFPCLPKDQTDPELVKIVKTLEDKNG